MHRRREVYLRRRIRRHNCRRRPPSKMLHRVGITIGLATIGLLVRVLFFADAFTRQQQIQAFFVSLVGIAVMWRGIEKINEFLNRKLPYTQGVMRRVAVQLVMGQVFLYTVLFVIALIVVPFFKQVELTREGIFAGLVVYFLVNIAANSGLIGNHFFNEWKKSLVNQSRLEKEKSQAHFDNLKNQLNPHFLFNSLSSLNSLIFENPDLASKFLKQLSKVYRYLLENNQTEFVTIETEMNFVQNYISLLQTRFDGGLEVNMNLTPETAGLKVVPVTLQILIENAIKHNITYEESPLIINIYVEDGFLIVQNNHQPKTRVEGSNKKGLDNLADLYYFTTGKETIIENTPEYFTVKVPLIAA